MAFGEDGSFKQRFRKESRHVRHSKLVTLTWQVSLKRAKLKPGWKMSQDQHFKYFQLWASVLKAQGWDKLPSADRESKRHEVMDRVFGPGRSAKQINKTSDFDAWVKECHRLTDTLDAGPDGERRRLLNGVGVALAELEELVAEQWLTTFLLNGWRIVPGLRTISDLTNDDLRKLIIAAEHAISQQ
jgi:hypothetical protein